MNIRANGLWLLMLRFRNQWSRGNVTDLWTMGSSSASARKREEQASRVRDYTTGDEECSGTCMRSTLRGTAGDRAKTSELSGRLLVCRGTSNRDMSTPYAGARITRPRCLSSGYTDESGQAMAHLSPDGVFCKNRVWFPSVATKKTGTRRRGGRPSCGRKTNVGRGTLVHFLFFFFKRRPAML